MLFLSERISEPTAFTSDMKHALMSEVENHCRLEHFLKVSWTSTVLRVKSSRKRKFVFWSLYKWEHETIFSIQRRVDSRPSLCRRAVPVCVCDEARREAITAWCVKSTTSLGVEFYRVFTRETPWWEQSRDHLVVRHLDDPLSSVLSGVSVRLLHPAAHLLNQRVLKENVTSCERSSSANKSSRLSVWTMNSVNVVNGFTPGFCAISSD